MERLVQSSRSQQSGVDQVRAAGGSKDVHAYNDTHLEIRVERFISTNRPSQDFPT